jgi:hypothetical protein
MTFALTVILRRSRRIFIIWLRSKVAQTRGSGSAALNLEGVRKPDSRTKKAQT